jgi:hypothetical protein
MFTHRTVVALLAGILFSGLVATAPDANAQAASAREGVVKNVEITRFGTFDWEVVKPADPKVKGSVPLLRAHMRQARVDIDGKVGESFGIWYRALGTAGASTEKGTLIVRVPGKGLEQDGKLVNEVSLPLELTAGTEAAYAFTIEDEAEHIPGTWVFEIWLSGAKMAQQSLNVH